MRHVVNDTAGLFNIQGYIDMAKAIFSGQLNLKTLFAGLADNHYVYVLMHLWVLNPFKGASNNDVTEMGKHIGGIVYDIAAAMVGAAAAKVLSVLKTTKVGSKIASTLSKAKCKIKTKTIGKITGKTYCFTAGTPVLLPDGMKPIEEIRKGDWVWSVAPETGDPELKQVEDVFVSETDEIVHVRYGDTEIDATPNHPFYVAEKGWVSAVNLRAGDRLQLVNGEYVTVEQVQHEILESPIKVYNFEVQDNHTYYVGGDDDDSAVLVHNKCKGIEPPRDRGGLRRKMDKLGNKPVGNYQAHHGLPWNYKDKFAEFGIDVNDVRFGIWTRGDGIHQKWSRRYDELWRKYLFESKEELSAAKIVRYFNKLNNKKVKF